MQETTGNTLPRKRAWRPKRHATAWTITWTTVILAASSAEATQTAAPPDPNKQLVRNFTEEVYNHGRKERIDAYVHRDFVDHSPGAPADARGPEYVKKQFETTYTAFPDLRFSVDDLLADGDKVVLRWTSHGHFSGRLNDLPGKGQEVTVQGISIFRILDGKFVESWDLVDRIGMFRQIGFQLVPPSTATPPTEETAPKLPKPKK